MHLHVHCRLFMKVKIQKQFKCQLPDECMDKTWSVHTQRNITHLQTEDEILPFATTRMNLLDIMLNKISHRKTNTVWSLSYMESKKVRLIEPES